MREQLENTGNSLSNRLKDSDSFVARLKAEIEEMKLSTANQISQLKLEHVAELAREKDKSANEREVLRLTSEKERRDYERTYEQEVFFPVCSCLFVYRCSTHLTSYCLYPSCLNL